MKALIVRHSARDMSTNRRVTWRNLYVPGAELYLSISDKPRHVFATKPNVVNPKLDESSPTVVGVVEVPPELIVDAIEQISATEDLDRHMDFIMGVLGSG